MPDIFELLNSDLGKQLITKTGNEAGISSEQTSEVLSMALPALMELCNKMLPVHKELKVY